MTSATFLGCDIYTAWLPSISSAVVLERLYMLRWISGSILLSFVAITANAVQVCRPPAWLIHVVFTLSHTRQHPTFGTAMRIIDDQVQSLRRPLVL
jgi:hypothetical protein